MAHYIEHISLNLQVVLNSQQRNVSPTANGMFPQRNVPTRFGDKVILLGCNLTTTFQCDDLLYKYMKFCRLKLVR